VFVKVFFVSRFVKEAFNQVQEEGKKEAQVRVYQLLLSVRAIFLVSLHLVSKKRFCFVKFIPKARPQRQGF